MAEASKAKTTNRAAKVAAPLNIHQRIARVMGEVSGVNKDGQVSGGGNWKFASHDAVVAAVRPHFVTHGIVMTLSLNHHQVNGNRLEAIYTVRFTNIDDPTDFIEVDFLGYGIDPSDKAPGKVISYVKKYAILVTLCLETGDDVDQTNQAHDPGGSEARQSPARGKRLRSEDKTAIMDACAHFKVPKVEALRVMGLALGRPVVGLNDIEASETDTVVAAIQKAGSEPERADA